MGVRSRGSIRGTAVALVVAAQLVGIPGASAPAGASPPSTFRVVAGGTLYSVACASASKCVAAGEGLSTTRYSTNGGTSWLRATTPIPGVASSVVCPTTSLCVAVGSTFNGSAGAAWRSINAGASWTAATLPHVPGLHTVSCASATRCLADGLLSTNGGQSWAAHAFPVSGFACDHGGSGHCVGVTPAGSIKYTANGGNTWVASTLPAGVQAQGTGATCASATVCYAPSGDSQGVLRSTNGGHTFTFVAIDTPESAVNSITDIACKTPTTCLLTGTFPNSGEVADEEPLVAYTTDGGMSWSGSTGPQADGWVTCTSSRCIVASTLITSVDSFSSGTWTVRLPIVGAGVGIGVSCYDTTHCIQNTSQLISYSSDGGQTWHNSTYSAALSFPLQGSAACVSGLHCFLAEFTADVNPGENYEILETTDGGAHWSMLSTGAQDMACPTTTHCIGLDVVNNQNTQADWTPMHGWVDTSLTGRPTPGPITCPASNRCYLISPDGIRVTTNQGTTWTGLPFHPISRFACVDATHCLATIGSAIERTTNGGSSWTTVLAHASVLTCNAAGRCLGQTSAGIVDSTDGGSTWHYDNVTAAAPSGNDARCRGSFCVIAGNATLRTP